MRLVAFIVVAFAGASACAAQQQQPASDAATDASIDTGVVDAPTDENVMCSPGELDPAFGIAGITPLSLTKPSEAAAVVLDSMQRSFVAGSSFRGGRMVCMVLRLLPSGFLDPTYGVGGVSYVEVGDAWCGLEDLVLMSDGSVVGVGGAFQGSVSTPLMLRLLPDGTLDPAFGQGGVYLWPESRKGRFTSVGRDSTERVLVSAYLAETPELLSPTVFSVVRYLPSGTLDTTFGDGGIRELFPQGQNAVHDLVVLGDDRVVAAGVVGDHGLQSSFGVARLTVDGNLDTTFHASGETTVAFDVDAGAFGLAVNTLGEVLVAGELSFPRGAIAKLDDVGLVAGFGVGGRVDLTSQFGMNVRRIASNVDGTSVVVGWRNVDAAGASTIWVARLLQDGAFDWGFGSNGVAEISPGGGDAMGLGLTLQPDGKVVVAGVVSGRATVARLCVGL